jgi:hypothetical protein
LPPVGDYLVTAAFNWNAGDWWFTDATPAGFTINWQKDADIARIVINVSLWPQKIAI